MIIGITGKMQHGKDTIAKIIKEFNLDFNIIHFADPLKKMCIEYFGLSEFDVYTDEGKKKYNAFWGMTNREILQKIGTDAFRNGFRNDVWVKLMELNLMDNSNSYIIPDVRFDDEAQSIIDHYGFIIEVIRDNVETNENVSKHVSEVGVNKKLIKYTIYNNGTLDDLKKSVKRVLEQEIKENVKNFFEKYKQDEEFKNCKKLEKFMYLLEKPGFHLFFSPGHNCVSLEYVIIIKNKKFFVSGEFYPNENKYYVYDHDFICDDIKEYIFNEFDKNVIEKINELVKGHIGK